MAHQQNKRASSYRRKAALKERMHAAEGSRPISFYFAGKQPKEGEVDGMEIGPLQVHEEEGFKDQDDADEDSEDLDEDTDDASEKPIEETIKEINLYLCNNFATIKVEEFNKLLGTLQYWLLN